MPVRTAGYSGISINPRLPLGAVHGYNILMAQARSDTWHTMHTHYQTLLGKPQRSGEVRAGDGTTLRWRAYGDPDSARVPLVCCNGLGCSSLFWRYLIEDFGPDRTVVIWDYRGHGLSDLPRGGVHFGIEDCADDAAAVSQAAGVEQAVFFGHSLGVQVALETQRRHPRLTRALVPVLGSYGHPLATFFNSALPGKLFPYIRELGMSAPRLISDTNRALARWNFTQRAAGLLGLIDADRMHPSDFAAYLDHLVHLDPTVLLGLAGRGAQHSAEDHLPRIDVPTLIVAAQRDLFTPAWLSERMRERIADAELLMIAGGSHAALVEHRELFHLRLEKFLRQRVDRDGQAR